MKYNGFLSLSDLPDCSEAQTIKEQIAAIHTPSSSYLENGYRFSDNHINEPYISEAIIMLPIECIADYIRLDELKKFQENEADIEEYVYEARKSPDLYFLFQQMKPIYLGLFAHVAVYTEKNNLRDVALELLQLYWNWVHNCIIGDNDKVKEAVKKQDEYAALNK